MFMTLPRAIRRILHNHRLKTSLNLITKVFTYCIKAADIESHQPPYTSGMIKLYTNYCLIQRIND